MKRSVAALAAGYIAILLIENFVRLIVTIYSGELVLSGITKFSNPFLGYLITAAGFLFGMIGGFLCCSIAAPQPNIAILSLIILIIAGSFLSFYIRNTGEPLWYLTSAPGLKAAGVYTAYIIFNRQQSTESISP